MDGLLLGVLFGLFIIAAIQDFSRIRDGWRFRSDLHEYLNDVVEGARRRRAAMEAAQTAQMNRDLAEIKARLEYEAREQP